MSPITLTTDAERMIAERMRRDGYQSPAEVVEAALLAMNDMDAAATDTLDADTLAAIDEANAQDERSEGMPMDEAFNRLRAKYQRQ